MRHSAMSLYRSAFWSSLKLTRHQIYHTNIFTVFSQYFHNVFTIFLRYFHDIITIFSLYWSLWSSLKLTRLQIDHTAHCHWHQSSLHPVRPVALSVEYLAKMQIFAYAHMLIWPNMGIWAYPRKKNKNAAQRRWP